MSTLFSKDVAQQKPALSGTQFLESFVGRISKHFQLCLTLNPVRILATTTTAAATTSTTTIATATAAAAAPHSNKKNDNNKNSSLCREVKR